ncbi:MAG: MauE/DoxX family redox-associated membrane protein, partial [Actinomycetota bacterium]
DRRLTVLLITVREIQIPVLSALLLGGCAAKLVNVLRARSLAAGLGPTALFPMHLRRPMANAMCATEASLGIGLILTSGRIARGTPANAVRLGTVLLFLVATCALIELRGSKPDVGCGCFGDFSTAPVSGRSMLRSALLAVAALTTVGLEPLRPPLHGTDVILPLGIFAAELMLIAMISPEVGEALVRLGYSEPCEMRLVPEARTLAALQRSSPWRRHAHLITADRPVDVWRELCWRYVVYPGEAYGKPVELVFAVYLRQHRPVIQAALVDSVSGGVLPWPPGIMRPGGVRLPEAEPQPRRDAQPRPLPAPRLPQRVPQGQAPGPAPILAAPTEPGAGVPAVPGAGVPTVPGTRFGDLPFSRDL